MSNNNVKLEEKHQDKNLTKRQYFVLGNLYYPLIIAVFTCFGLITNIVVRKQQIRATKIETVSELAKNFTDYYYSSGVSIHMRMTIFDS